MKGNCSAGAVLSCFGLFLTLNKHKKWTPWDIQERCFGLINIFDTVNHRSENFNFGAVKLLYKTV